MSIINIIDEEIKSSHKNEKPIYVELHKKENSYRGFSKTKIEGDFILNAKNLDDVAVSIKFNQGEILIAGIESEEEVLQAFLLKDSTAILRAVKKQIKKEELSVVPSFLVGPPGTGKSTVIVNTIKESIRDQRILVLSPTHMAVENVFERLDLEELGLKDGEIILNINTENEALKAYHSDVITGNSRIQIADEQEILKSAKEDLILRKRNLETIVYDFKNKIEQEDILFKSMSQEVAQIETKIKTEKINKKELEKRLALIMNNSVLNSIKNLFAANSDKKDEIENSINFSEKQIQKYEDILSAKEDKLNSIKKIDKTAFREKEKELNEVADGIKTINNRLKELEKAIEDINGANIYKSARLVGATLVSAAINKKLQLAEFDKIIIDEASMALYPHILSASQCLNDAQPKVIKIKHNPKLTDAQNKGVELLANSKLALIGDPRQLSPIASTAEMRETIFEKFEVEKIFDGDIVPNSVMLDINFRNHQDITNLASSMFYGGKLKAGKALDGNSLYTIKNKSQMYPTKGSFTNPGNANLVVYQVERALKKGRRSVGIVTPYREQAALINKRLEPLRELYEDADISAGTVHKFQGKEKDIIIFDLCFSVTEGAVIPKAYEGGLKSETAKLLNVAMTRAESFFILVGDTEGIKGINQANFLLKDWIKGIEKIKK